MKRDMDYVRELLLKIEAAPDDVRSSRELAEPDATAADIDKLNYHLHMLTTQVGLVEGLEAHTMSTMSWLHIRLTWAGHEFLEAVRDDGIWSKTKEGAKRVGSQGFDFILDLAKAYAKHLAKERLGFDL